MTKLFKPSTRRVFIEHATKFGGTGALLCEMTPLLSCRQHPSHSHLEAWKLEGNIEAAREFIVETVLRFFPDTQSQTSILRAFAHGLQNQRTSQTESADFVLELYWKQSQAGTVHAPVSPIQSYIVEQFVVATNYMDFLSGNHKDLVCFLTS